MQSNSGEWHGLVVTNVVMEMGDKGDRKGKRKAKEKTLHNILIHR